MVLQYQQIIEKLKNPDPRIEAARKQHHKYLMHVHGIGADKYIIQVEGLENDTKIKLRKKLSRSNKDLFADVLSPVNKVFSAKGGSKDYLLSESQKEDFKKTLADITDGLSLEKWLQNIWMDKYIVDPNGLVLIEIESDPEIKAYPTYKSIDSIIDYEQNGQGVEYVIFDYGDIDDKKIVRVYDDQSDRLYLWDKEEKIQLIEGEEYINTLGYVPAVICSDLVDPISFYKRSPIYEVDELADEYLRENSVKTLYKYHHGFPMFWQYKTGCKHCNGTGEYKDEVCVSCSGTGYATKKDVSDVSYLTPPTDSETPILAPDIAGYVVPPIESLKQMTEELKHQRDSIYFTQWGTIINRDDKQKTAFEVGSNLMPMQDKLNKFSDSKEIVETYITDILGQVYFGEAYNGSSINAGRVYIIKSPNELMKEYLDEKSKGAGTTVLNDKLIQYYESLYKNDQFNLVIYRKLIEVEPLVHNTIDEVLKMQVPQTLKDKKILYNDWLSTMKRDQLFTMTVERLKESLRLYVEQKVKEDGTNEVQGLASPAEFQER